ncbi:MAG: BlaI/MecI/CopY family transcriptional regulator [Bacteroidales bacterium]|nr:BlaI/MecI/CopY family transcriptional regulator [Bacteroidales bacterium]
MKRNEIKELTRAEEQVMQAIWNVQQGFANEIVTAVNERNDPKDSTAVAYNTVLTVVRILEQKGFVAHETFNRANRYYPIVSREEYMEQMLGRMTRSWFGSSSRALVSFLVDRNEVTLQDLETLTNEIEQKQINNK